MYVAELLCNFYSDIFFTAGKGISEPSKSYRPER